MRSKSQKGWHKSSIHYLYKALCAHKARLYFLVQTEQDFFAAFNPGAADEQTEARHSCSTHGVTRDWFRPLAITSVQTSLKVCASHGAPS